MMILLELRTSAPVQRKADEQHHHDSTEAQPYGERAPDPAPRTGERVAFQSGRDTGVGDMIWGPGGSMESFRLDGISEGET